MIESIYKEWVHYILDYIKNNDYNEFNINKHPSFTIPHLGKLVCTEYKIKAINNKKNGRN